MEDFNAPGAAAVNLDKLPIAALKHIFSEAVNQDDKLAAFYEIDYLRANERFKELIATDPTIRSNYETLQGDAQAARTQIAKDEAGSADKSSTADEIIARHDAVERVNERIGGAIIWQAFLLGAKNGIEQLKNANEQEGAQAAGNAGRRNPDHRLRDAVTALIDHIRDTNGEQAAEGQVVVGMATPSDQK
ncbi:hypothetical protein C6558_31820 [Ensifer sp. NM-2]|uniref:hypothetical protein n=1 Tax=Ensifer sp. NM-2 TaxID=2109730 RepID=UPI000D12AE27|nr:hypothetical protein [Ensifer sp. NM-2]PSS60575.1 hypothetical protein C6558_31820 [Ensifer sp. NM-2]